LGYPLGPLYQPSEPQATLALAAVHSSYRSCGLRLVLCAKIVLITR
jgi:hypothetical protein